MARFARRALDQLIVLRPGEGWSVALMFAYSFLAMTSYNILKPITRSRFITSFGAHNLPWVMLAAGLLIGVLMHQYARAIRRLPRQAVVPVTLAGIVVLQLVFWVLLQTGSEAASAGLYLFGQILGILLISQFWTLANDVYDARQAQAAVRLHRRRRQLWAARSAPASRRCWWPRSAASICCWSAPRRWRAAPASWS
jgi:ATP/ADP translocase